MASRKQWSTDLPDTGKWLPREHAATTLQKAFLKRCQDIEQRIILRARQEKNMNVDNFDSGPGVEDIIREELSNLLPKRYSVRAGTVHDRKGRTAGDFEIIITNDFWFTPVKAGATNQSRKYHFPIEAVYAVIEVKQTLTYETLDQAMEKLVKCHRLYRPAAGSNQAVENLQIFDPLPNVVRNPLSSTIFATSLGSELSMEDIGKRFFEISKALKRDEIIHNICVLDQGTIAWTTPGMIALFQEDRDKPITPLFYRVQEMGSAFYTFAAYLMTHLNKSVLESADIAVAYGVEEGRFIAKPVVQNEWLS